jgi:hypothetical protein
MASVSRVIGGALAAGCAKRRGGMNLMVIKPSGESGCSQKGEGGRAKFPFNFNGALLPSLFVNHLNL